MKTRSLFLIPFLVLLINTNPVFTQWVRTNGPCGRGGEIMTICINDSYIFAGTDRGVYVSNDGGRSWLNRTPQVPSYGAPILCTALAVEGQYLFATMGVNGVYVSINNGDTWTHIGNGLPSYGITKMVVSGTKVIGVADYLYQTTDNGSSWSVLDSIRNVISLMAQDSLVFAGTYGGILRSSDYGTSWTQVYSTNVGSVNAIAKSGERVFANVSNSIIGSIDGGITWNADSSVLNCNIIKSIVTSPVESGNNYVYAGTDLGVYRSLDNGISWTSMGPGFNSSLVITLAFKKDQMSGKFVLLAGTGAGIYSSTDYGETWVPTGIPSGIWYLTALGSDLFAGSTSREYLNGGIGNDNRCGVYRSSDLGMTWSEADQGLISQSQHILTSLTSFPNVSGGFHLFAGATSSYQAGYGLVFASSDRGATWVSVIPDSLGGLFPTVFNDSPYLFAGSSGRGLFRSTDNGLTWFKSDSGIAMPTVFGRTGVYVNAFAKDGSKLYAGGGYSNNVRVSKYFNYIVSSTNDGASWSPVDSGFSTPAIPVRTTDTISVLKTIYASGSHLLVGTQSFNYDIYAVPSPYVTGSGGGIYHIINNGSVCTLIDSALMGKQISSILSNKQNIFAAATGSGVFHSNDNGTTWRNISNGLLDSSVTSLLVAGTYLFAATESGVWKRPLSEITSVNHGMTGTNVPERYSLSQNYPNPFNPTTQIKYSIPKRSYITLKVYNFLGQLVRTLFDGVQEQGNFEVLFDGKGLASGMYLFRLTSSGFTETKKLILIK